tara:strand:- start:1576 stop:1836 length:261 start_codon:yes stop_codon:yes gene_type:complete
MALALSYPGLDVGISISLDNKMYSWDMPSVLTQNICCLNARNVTVHQFSKPSQVVVCGGGGGGGGGGVGGEESVGQQSDRCAFHRW